MVGVVRSLQCCWCMPERTARPPPWRRSPSPSCRPVVARLVNHRRAVFSARARSKRSFFRSRGIHAAHPAPAPVPSRPCASVRLCNSGRQPDRRLQNILRSSASGTRPVVPVGPGLALFVSTAEVAGADLLAAATPRRSRSHGRWNEGHVTAEQRATNRSAININHRGPHLP